MAEPPASPSAFASALSSPGSEGVLKSISNAISLTPADCNFASNRACRLRRHGHTPICAIDFGSIATTTTPHVAWRSVALKRQSLSTFCRLWVGAPHSTTASAHATKICNRSCFTSPSAPRTSSIKPASVPTPSLCPNYLWPRPLFPLPWPLLARLPFPLLPFPALPFPILPFPALAFPLPFPLLPLPALPLPLP